MQSIACNGIIVLNKGDSFRLPIPISELYQHLVENPLVEKFNLYFSIMEPNTDFNHGIVRKKIACIRDTASESIPKPFILDEEESSEFVKINPNGEFLILLFPTDTERLLAGTYYYEIKLQYFMNPSNGGSNSDEETLVEYIDTITQKTKFILLN